MIPVAPIKVRQTDVFARWFAALSRPARQSILSRIDRLALGNVGDVKPVGGGISEFRLHHGPGHRLSLARRGEQIVLLLCGGDQSSQPADIVRACDILADLETEDGD